MSPYPFTTPNGDRAWADDPNTPVRFVVRRAENRFQAYEHFEGKFYSVGYFLTRDDIRPFLAGDQVEVMSEFGEDIDTEPLIHPAFPDSQRTL